MNGPVTCGNKKTVNMKFAFLKPKVFQSCLSVSSKVCIGDDFSRLTRISPTHDNVLTVMLIHCTNLKFGAIIPVLQMRKMMPREHIYLKSHCMYNKYLRLPPKSITWKKIVVFRVFDFWQLSISILIYTHAFFQF